MKYTYLHDLSIIQVGKKYHFRLMPDNRSVTGTVILIEVNPENPSKGKIHTENNADRFYVDEYQYLQYAEYVEQTLPPLFSNVEEFRAFVKLAVRDGMECEGTCRLDDEIEESIEKIVKDRLRLVGIEID